VIEQVTQISPSDSNLLTDSYASNSSDSNFQQYLDNEQQRIAFSYSPMAFFNFDSWFGYADNSSKENKSSSLPKIFSDINLYQDQNISNQTEEFGTQNLLSDYNFNSSEPKNLLLQNLLQETGWLTPNISALPMFAFAQNQGTLLQNIDLQSLVDKIVSQLKIVKEKGEAKLIMGLKPENLGEILLTLTSRSGMIAIQIEANEETKKILDQQLEKLALALKKAKVNLEDIKVIASKEVAKHV